MKPSYLTSQPIAQSWHVFRRNGLSVVHGVAFPAEGGAKALTQEAANDPGWAMDMIGVPSQDARGICAPLPSHVGEPKPSVRHPRRLTTIVCADVAEYSRLMGRDEEGTFAGLKDHTSQWIEPTIAQHGGRIVKTMGDGLLVEFASVVEAVRCAVDIQLGMTERNLHVPAEQRIRFRVGINTGDVIVDGDDILGDAVNVAARLQALAEPGGICASRAVCDHVSDKLRFVFDNLGSHRVKNIDRPIDVYRIQLGMERGWSAPRGRYQHGELST
jgi:class 3 adenylate cyclase